MAGLMDMYAAFNSPQVSTGDYANVQQRKNDLQSRRFSGLGEIASRNSIEQLQKEYNSKTGRFIGMDEETAFKAYYDALSMIDPTRAKQEADMRNQNAEFGLKQQIANTPKAVTASTAPVYNAQQKQVIDALGGVDREFERASRMYNVAAQKNDSANMIKYKGEMDEISGRRKGLTNSLSTLGVSAYDNPKVTTTVVDAATNVDEVKSTVGSDTATTVDSVKPIDLDTNNGKRREFVKNNYFKISSYSELPSTDDIIADAEYAGYVISGKKAEDILSSLERRVENKRRDADYGRGISQQNKQESNQQTQTQLIQDEKFQPLFKANERLKANMQDIPARRTALNLALRKETGAVIGADEFDAMMSTLLPASDYARFKKDTQGVGIAIAGMASPALQEQYLKKVAEGYLGNIDAGKLYQYLDDKIPADYYQKKTAGKKTAEAPKEESKLERIRSLRAKKGNKV